MLVAVCDVCGHRWIPEVENPTLCPKKDCRSTLWNKGGLDGRTREARKKAQVTKGGRRAELARRKREKS